MHGNSRVTHIQLRCGVRSTLQPRVTVQVGDSVLHIDLTKWADILVIAPLTPHCMAQLAHGLCDDLTTCVARAWPTNKPLLMVPAMHQSMWQHPITLEQLQKLAVHSNYCIAVGSQLLCGPNIANAGAPPEGLPDVRIIQHAVQQCSLAEPDHG